MYLSFQELTESQHQHVIAASLVAEDLVNSVCKDYKIESFLVEDLALNALFREKSLIDSDFDRKVRFNKDSWK